MEKALRLFLAGAFANRDDLAGHQVRDLFVRVLGKANVAVGHDADQLAGLAGACGLHDGDAGNLVLRHQHLQVAQRGVRRDRDRIDHHPGFEPLHLADLFRLLFQRKVAVDHADAAGLRHGNRQFGFGHRIHRRGQQRNVQIDLARQTRGRVRLRGHDVAFLGLQEHVVKRDTFPNLHRAPPCLLRGRFNRFLR